MAAIGIDLGTTYSLAGYVNYDGVPALFPDRHDASLFRTPSVMHIDAAGCYVGTSVEQMLEETPQLPVIRFAKLALGIIAEEFSRRHGFDPRRDAAASTVLRRLAEETKIKLGRPGSSQVSQDALLAGRPIRLALTRRHFDQVIQPMLEKSFEVCERCLQAAGLDWSKIDQVQLVGGASLMPAVAERLRQRSGKSEQEIVCRHPHQAVAFGAAMIAAQTAPALQQSVAAHDLCLRTRDPRNGALCLSRMIAQNAALPARVTKTFRTNRGDQRRMVLDIVQSRGETISSIGRFTFELIREPREGYPIHVTFECDREGLVHITAEDAATGERMRVTLDSATPEAGQVTAQDRALVASMPLLG